MAADPSTSSSQAPAQVSGVKRSFDIAFLVSTACGKSKNTSPPSSPPAKTGCSTVSAFTRVQRLPTLTEPPPLLQEVSQPLQPRALLARIPPPRLPLPYPLQLGLELLQQQQNHQQQQQQQHKRTPLLAPLAGMYPGQNVCALCRISFRMTSDLVYHMRSHHRKQEDQQRRAREEKLRCAVCGEAFRERHHLTRHMTAHTERDEEAR